MERIGIIKSKTSRNEDLNDVSESVDYQFKLLYTIGTIFVICDHCYRGGGITLLENWFPKGSFHLALFVFCSGYFYKTEYDRLASRFVIKKFKRLIIPMYGWNIFYAIVTIMMSSAGFEFGAGHVTLKKILYDPWINGQQFIYNLGSWFVVPLFLVQTYTVLIRTFTKKWEGIVKDTLLLMFSFLLGIFGIILANKGYSAIGWWRTATRTMYFIPFYSCGFYYRFYLNKAFSKVRSDVLFSIIFVITLIIIVVHRGTYNFTPSSSDFMNTNPLIVYLVGFLAIAFWVRISSILEISIGKAGIVSVISNNSFSIMVNQFTGFMLVKCFFAVLYKYGDICRDFDMTAFHTNIWYYYIPYNISQIALLYTVFGITIPILMQKGIDLLAEKIHYILRHP